MYKCKKCNFETNEVSKIANHYQYVHKENNKVFCDKCGKVFLRERGLKCHTKESCDKNIEKKNINHICPKCNFFISNNITKHVNFCNGFGPRSLGRPKKNKISLKGISFDERFGIEKSNEIKIKISEKAKGSNKNPLTLEKELEKRRKLSEHAKKNGYGGYIRGSGRGKCGWYDGYWSDSSWELAFIIYNLDHNIKFERNNNKFEYFYNNQKSYYIPDFIINNEYYEIKGYMDKKNEAKHKQFPHNLHILYENDLKYVFEYVIEKYGKNFIRLYKNGEEKNCSLCGGYIYKYNKNGICIKCIKK